MWDPATSRSAAACLRHGDSKWVLPTLLPLPVLLALSRSCSIGRTIHITSIALTPHNPTTVPGP